MVVVGLALVVQPVVELVLTGLNRIKTPQPALKEQQRESEKLGRSEVVLVIIHVWTGLSLTHARPVRSLHVYVEYVYIHTWLQNVVNSTSSPSSHTHMLFVFTIALWDTIAELPLLPAVKQDYWGCSLLFLVPKTTKTMPIVLSVTHKCTMKHTLACKAKG